MPLAEHKAGKDEILFLHTAQYQCDTGICLDYPLLFVTSTAMELESSIQSPVSVNTTWKFIPTGQGGTSTCLIIFTHYFYQVGKPRTLPQSCTPLPAHCMH